MSKNIRCWQDCRDENKVKSVLFSKKNENKIKVRKCNGSHVVVTEISSGDTFAGYLDKEISSGVARKIFIKLVEWGLIGILIFVILFAGREILLLL